MINQDSCLRLEKTLSRCRRQKGGVRREQRVWERAGTKIVALSRILSTKLGFELSISNPAQKLKYRMDVRVIYLECHGK